MLELVWMQPKLSNKAAITISFVLCEGIHVKKKELVAVESVEKVTKQRMDVACSIFEK
jgi:hypothetical protein